jgi:hypothetical protein
MNLYQLMWDERGYGKRRAKILACGASDNRKLSALNRLWSRMVTA